MTGGMGTILSGILDDTGFNEKSVKIGMAQCVLAPIFFGWIWGILHMWSVYQYQLLKFNQDQDKSYKSS